MLAVQFIFKPGTYDEEFFTLDNSIEDYVASLPGFLGVEKWQSADGLIHNPIYYFEDNESFKLLAQFGDHKEAKANYRKWYDGYQIIVSKVISTYGDGTVETLAAKK